MGMDIVWVWVWIWVNVNVNVNVRLLHGSPWVPICSLGTTRWGPMG